MQRYLPPPIADQDLSASFKLIIFEKAAGMKGDAARRDQWFVFVWRQESFPPRLTRVWKPMSPSARCSQAH